MKKQDIILQATRFRKSGYSYKYIADKFGISPSTSHLWLRNVVLSEYGRNKLHVSQQKGREKGVDTMRLKRIRRNLEIFSIAQSTISNIKATPSLIKSFCALLYWAEGSKTRSGVGFVNSDPEMIKMFLTIFRKGFSVNEDKLHAFLHLHAYHNQSKQIAFWSKITGIPKTRIFIYNKPNSGKNIRKNYPGCIAIRYNDVRVFNEIKYTYKLLARNMGA